MSVFAKNIIKLSSGNALALLISVGCMPIITRLYSPDDFGIYAIYFSILGIIYPISTLRYNSAIVLPESDDEAFLVLILSLIAVICTTFLSFIIVFALNSLSLVDPEIITVLWWFPLGVLINGFLISIMFWGTRLKLFGSMAVSRCLDSIADRGLVLSLGLLFASNPLFLVMGRLFGPFVSFVQLARNSFKSGWPVPPLLVSTNEIIQVAKRYRDFPLFASWAFFFSWGGLQLIPLLLAAEFSAIVVGYFFLVTRILNAPTMLVGDAIAKIYMQKASEMTDHLDSGLADLSLFLFKMLLMMIVPFFYIIETYGIALFSWFFGEDWKQAGLYSQILISAFSVFLIVRVFSVLFDILEYQKARLKFSIISFIINIGVVMLLSNATHNIYITLCGYAISDIIINLVILRFLFNRLGISFFLLIKITLSSCLLFSPLLIGLLLSLKLDQFFVVIVIGCAVVAELFIITIFEKDTLILIIRKLKNT